MCDKIAGELLMCFHRRDRAALQLLEQISSGVIPHVEIIENLDERLSQIDLEIRPALEFLFYRLRVPPGEEEWKVNYLQFFYKHAVLKAREQGQMDEDILCWSGFHLQIVPHSILSTVGSPPLGFGTITLTQTHTAYKQFIGWRAPPTSSAGPRILILDTGADSSIAYNPSESRNFVDPGQKYNVADDNGHGTAVATIITDLCPSADVVVFKVADRHGRASEWDTLAGLAAASQANVINMSLAFGLDEMLCPTCGRESPSSRSAVFENLVAQVDRSAAETVIVAAAGNRKKSELSFPSRFSSVVAVESVDSAGNLSEFTNRSTTDHEGHTHPNVFVLPGGQTDVNDNVIENSVETSLGKKYCGTSFAAAYASALIAVVWSDPRHKSKDHKQVLNHLRASADTNFANYDQQVHGNGLMRLA